MAGAGRFLFCFCLIVGLCSICASGKSGEMKAFPEGKEAAAAGTDEDFALQDWEGIWSGVSRYADGSEEPVSLEVVRDSEKGWRVKGELFDKDEWIWIFEGNILEGSTIACVADPGTDSSGKTAGNRTIASWFDMGSPG